MEHPILIAIRREGFEPLGWFEPQPSDGIAQAKFVLLVCTEAHTRRVNGGDAAVAAPGVDWETNLIRSELHNARTVMMEDWNRDENMDVIASRQEGPPLLLEKQRGGRLVPREPTNWVAGAVFCTGDFDNDLRPDLAIASPGKITICFNGGTRTTIAVPASANFRQLVAADYDNDGWLDLWAVGDKIQVWRNRGLTGFQEQTGELGLDKFEGGAVSAWEELVDCLEAIPPRLWKSLVTVPAMLWGPQNSRTPRGS